MIYWKVSLQYETKTLKAPPCIYVKISFSLAVSTYIILFINEILHVTVKYNVRDKIYRVNHRKGRISRKEQSKWIVRPVINKTCISSIADKKISKYVLLLLLFLLRIQQSLVNNVQFSCRKHQIAHTSVGLSAVFSLIVNRFYISQYSKCYVRVREVRFTIR